MRTALALLCLMTISALAAGQNAVLERARAQAAETAADALARASHRDPGGLGGYRDEFFLSDAAGDNTFHFGGIAQVRYLASLRRVEAPLIREQRFTSGFQVQHVIARAHGAIASPDLRYRVEAGFDSLGMAELLEATLGWVNEEGWGVEFGQLRPRLTREHAVDWEFGLAVERSQAGRFFDAGSAQGIEASHASQTVRFFAGITDGLGGAGAQGSANTPFDSDAEGDVALHARAEWMFAGSDWERFDRHSSWRSTPSYAGLVGAALAWQTSGSTGASPSPAPEGSEFRVTVDASVQGSGWNFTFAFFANHLDPDAAAARDDLGLLVQGGCFVTDRLEVFGRFDALRLDADSLRVAGAARTLNFATLGVNYFLVPESHAARLSADLVWALNRTDGLIDPGAGDTTTALLGSSKPGEVDLRVQLQVKF